MKLEAIGKDGKVLDPGQIAWANADPFQSKGVVDMTGVNSKSVTLTKQGETRPLNVTVVRAGSSDDINELLKMLIVEVLTTKKQEALDSLTILRQDSINNARNLIDQIARLESGNLPMEDIGVKPVALFADPPAVSLQDSIAFQAGNDRKAGFEHLRKRKRLKNTIRKKVNVVALANLIVDQPEKINLLLDGLLLNSGRLVARLILNKDSQGKRDEARNIVVDFLNQNLERIAGSHFTQPLEPEPALPIPPAPTPPSFAFSPEEPLYVSPMVGFEGKETFITEMKAYLMQLEPRVYVAINYSQDVSTESYIERVRGTRPKGVPEGHRYIGITLVNIPGSIEFNITGPTLWSQTEGDISILNILRDGIKSLTSTSDAGYATFEQKLLEKIGQEYVSSFDCIGEAYNRYIEAEKRYGSEQVAIYASAIKFWLCVTTIENCKRQPFACGFTNGLLQELDWITFLDDVTEFEIKKEDIARILNCIITDMPIGRHPDNPTSEDVIFKCLTGASLSELKTGINDFIIANWDEPYYQGQATAFALTLLGPLKAGIIKKLEKLPKYASRISKLKSLSVAKNGDEIVSIANRLAKGVSNFTDFPKIKMKIPTIDADGWLMGKYVNGELQVVGNTNVAQKWDYIVKSNG